MAVVKEIKIGNSVCRICDDHIKKTDSEVQAILDRIAAIAAEAEERKIRSGTT